jgi:adenylate cyclase
VAENSVQRRLAAILAADVVGYSRLVGQDEDGTLAAVRTLRAEVIEPKIAEHQGRLFKTTGDGFLAEFPSVVNAVTCALAVQRAMSSRNAELPEDRKVELRIGIHLGDVVAEDGDVYGDGVNVAARIEGLAPPGGIVVSAMVRDNIGSRLDLAFEDMGEQQLKNIAKPLRVYLLGASRVATPMIPVVQQTKPSIAVLPFTNMSSDPEQEYFSDGITEDIITELSRFHNLFVIARNSSFAYKGKSVDVRTVARELRVEYVLEGSVRKSAQRVRITAQLIDAMSGRHVWADRYDLDLSDIFAIQDEVTASIVGALSVEIEDEFLERAKHKPPDSLEAYDHWLRGKRLIFLMGESSLEARDHFQSAIAVDPSFSRAHSGLGMTYQMEALNFPLPEVYENASDKALECAQRALSLDETNHQAHLGLAYAYLYRHNSDLVRKHIMRAIRLNPNDGDILANAAYFLPLIGDAAAGIKYGEAALRHNPRHPDWYVAFTETGYFALGDYDRALELRMRAPDGFIDSRFSGAAILAHLGRLDEARSWVDKGMARLATTPGGAVAIAEGRVVDLLLANNPWLQQADADRFVDGMRKAGVPG